MSEEGQEDILQLEIAEGERESKEGNAKTTLDRPTRKRKLFTEHNILKDAQPLQSRKRARKEETTSIQDFFQLSPAKKQAATDAKLSLSSPREKHTPLRSDGSLLACPISHLLDQIDDDRREELFRESRNESRSVPVVALSENQQLWVDKYAPHSFPHLLTDEKLNRTVLKWIVSWGKSKDTQSTIGKNKPPSPKQNKLTAKGRGRGKMPSKKSANDMKSEDFAEAGEHKVLLLHGAPGTGKTTLAHVAARQAGYRPYEINASDDRSARSMMEKLLSALENISVDAGKPNCIIIDEIDGVLASDAQGAVDAILKIIKYQKKKSAEAKQKSTEGDKNDDGDGDADKQISNATGSLKRKKTKTEIEAPSRVLSRPIICICNDLYVPALRKLRDIALTFHVTKPDTNRLCSRLKEICAAEKLVIDAKSLLSLIELADHDMRSCLHTLQFLSNDPEHKKLDGALDGLKESVGRKDIKISVFDVWKDIFQRPLKHSLKLSGTKDKEADLKSLADQLYNRIEHHADRNLIIEGIHHNFLSNSIHDPLFQKTSSSFDWLCWSDLISTKMYEDQAFSLGRYTAAVGPAIHLHFSQSNYPVNITFPRNANDPRNNAIRVKSILKNFKSDKSLYSLPSQSLVLEYLPSLYDTIVPISKAAPTVDAKQEKETIHRISLLMNQYNIAYNSTTWTLDPPIHEVVKFNHLATPSMPEQLKKSIQKEIELEKVRQTLSATELHEPSKKSDSKKPQPLKKQVDKEANKNKETKATQTEPVKKEAVTRDFFGRIVQKNDTLPLNSPPKKTSNPPSPSKSAIVYKYQEGYTNAVRRNVYVKDFL